MNIAGLVGALIPVFFVLALGYVAGKRNAFDADQAGGLSKLALSFALPASLFVSMTDIRKDLLLQQGPLVLALILAHAGLFLAAWLGLRFVKSLRATPSTIYALILSTSATPVFRLARLDAGLGSHGADDPLAEQMIHEENADWLLPTVLSTTAGAVDVIGFLTLGGLFTAHITGNLVVLAAHYVTGRFSEIGPLLSVPVFVIVLGIIMVLFPNKATRRTRRTLLLIHASLLVGFLVLDVGFDHFTEPDRYIK